MDGEGLSGAWLVECYNRLKPVATISAPQLLAEILAIGGGMSVGKAGQGTFLG